MIRSLTDTALVARYELAEALRTRLFQLVVLAYLCGVALSVWLQVTVLWVAESNVAEALQVPMSSRPGTLLPRLLANGAVRDALAPMVGGRDAAGALLDQPVLALGVGLTAMALLPAVLVFTASGTVSTEVRSRSIRFLLVRTGRTPIVLGKALGQLALGAVALTLGGLVAWAMGLTMMTGNDPAALFLALAARSVCAAAFALPYLGIAMATSLWITSPNGARLGAALACAATPVLGALLRHRAGPDALGRIADLLTLAIPTGSWNALWSTDPAVLAAAFGRSLLLTTIFLAVGLARFERRDL